LPVAGEDFDLSRTREACLKERGLKSIQSRKSLKKRSARGIGQIRLLRIARNVVLIIVLWFALLGVCIISYDYYFKFSN
jgi:hypothetical protein